MKKCLYLDLGAQDKHSGSVKPTGTDEKYGK
jgi:hypothetical protein